MSHVFQKGGVVPASFGLTPMSDTDDLGWGGDHVGKLNRLQTAVKLLAQCRGKTSERLEKATYALVGLFPRDFPKHLQNRARNVLGLREKYVFHAGGDSYFYSVLRRNKRSAAIASGWSPRGS